MELQRAEQWYRRLLVLLPKEFRGESETDLLEVFRDEWRHRGGWGMGFWLRITLDLVVTAMAERSRKEASGRSRSLMRGTGLDLKQALRRLQREPLQAASSVLALGVGLAAATVVITLVRSVLLAPLPFESPQELVRLIEVDSSGMHFYPSFPNIRDWSEHSRFLDGIAASDVPQMQTVLYGGGAERVLVGAVSRDFFRTLSVEPEAGRFFTELENSRGGPPVAVVSEEFWRSRLGGQSLNDLTLTIGSEAFSVIGVLPAGFRFLGEPGDWTNAAVWLPLERAELGSRQSHGYHTVARLRPGVTLASASAQMNALASELKQRHGEPTQADRVAMTLLRDEVVGRARAPLRLLLGAAVFVLMVTCFNLGGAILARGLSRTRELAIRLSLGGRRREIMRHLQLESSVLVIPGAALAIAIAAAVLHVLRTSQFSVPRLDEVKLDTSMVALTLVLALLITVLASLVPSLMLTARHLPAWLRTHGATAGTREHRSLWNGFVAGQVALTLVLLSGTGLLLRSLQRVMERDVGYEPNRLLAVDVSLPETLYPDAERRVAYYAQALDRVRALAGVEAAGLTGTLPHEPTARTGTTYALHNPELRVYAGFRLVDPGYFVALGVTGVRGELLEPSRPRANVAVIDEHLSTQLWSGASPLGLALWNSFHEDTLSVIGTVTSVREWNQDQPVGAVYVDYRLQGEALLDMHLIIRPYTAEVARAVRGVFQRLDPMVPVTLEPLDSRIARTFGERRLLLAVAGGFAGVSLLLAVLGVYAIVGYAIGRELKSVAIRLVLGARPAGVVRTVMLAGFRPVALGLLIGLAVVVPALSAVRSQLVDVSAFDPVSLLLGTLVLLAGAGMAAWLPARTVGRVDARTILQHD